MKPPFAIELADVSKIYRRYSGRHFATLKSALLQRSILRDLQPDETFPALTNVSFAVAEGSTFGVIGRNGSGKSTALKLVAGITKPTSGTVRVRGRISALIELGAGFHPEISGRENVFINGIMLGLTKQEIQARFDEIVDFAELREFIDAPVKTYSSGMYMRLGFAVAIHVDPDVLLVDEVLAVGDEVFQRKCLDRVRQFQREGRTIVFVTHAVDLVRQICDEAVMLDHGRIHASGNPEEVVRQFRQENLRYQVEEGRQWGTREMEIVSADLIREAGATDTPVRPGETLIVQADVRSPSPVEDVVAVIALYDHENRTIFRANTGVLGVPIDPFEGKRRIRFRIRSVPMARGRYSVTVAVHSRDERRIYHVWEEALSFEVRHEGYDPGEVFTPVAVEVEEL
jgi:ABC-type polysaccharide/polyol phosphate transport system ATPase subunit